MERKGFVGEYDAFERSQLRVAASNLPLMMEGNRRASNFSRPEKEGKCIYPMPNACRSALSYLRCFID